MRISEQKQNELYRSISNPITELRVNDQLGKIPDMDEALFDLERTIWKRVAKVLKI